MPDLTRADEIERLLELEARLRRMAVAVYLATEAGPAADLSAGLREAADAIRPLAEQARRVRKLEAENATLKREIEGERDVRYKATHALRLKDDAMGKLLAVCTTEQIEKACGGLS